MAENCAIILGMHRSGTSALSGVLRLLGVEFGDDLIGPSGSNAKGHFESIPAVAFNDRVLRRFRSRWKRSFRLPADWASTLAEELPAFRRTLRVPAQGIWGLKDPRLCRLVPVWREILSGLALPQRFLVCMRHPDEVVASLARRDGLEPGRARALWIEHVCAAEADTRNATRLLLTFEELLAAPEETASRMAAFLGLPAPTEDELAAVREFLDPQLRHERVKAGSPGLAATLYDLLRHGESAEAEALVDEIRGLQGFREECVRSETPAVGFWQKLRR